MKKIKELLLPIYIILNIIYITTASYFYRLGTLSYKDFSKTYIILLILNILVLITLFIIRKIKNKKLNFNILDIFLLFILLFSGISVVFAINRNVAIFGMPGRYEGILQILYYFSLYFLSTYVNEKHKKKIIYTIILCGIANLIYAVFQILKIGNTIRIYRNGKIWATGLTTNPGFFATYMLLCMSYVLGLFIDENNFIYKLIYGSLIFIFMIGLLISNAMSTVVGLIIVLIYILIYIIKNKKYKEIISIILILTTATVFIYKANLTTLIEDIDQTTNETKEIVKGNLDDGYGTHRLFIWKNTLKIVPKNIINGVGIDNFYYAFGDKPIARGIWFFDKAHNEYLQILITEGIFAIISYLLLYGWIVIKGIKNSYKNKEIHLLLPVIGYLIQAFFNISVIEVAPFFYISLGLLVDRGISNEKSKRNNTST